MSIYTYIYQTTPEDELPGDPLAEPPHAAASVDENKSDGRWDRTSERLRVYGYYEFRLL